MKWSSSIFVALGLMASVAACGSDDDSGGNTGGTGATGGTGGGSGGMAGHAGHHGEEPDEEACEHFEEGPYKSVTASADKATAPDINAVHTAHEVTLVDAGGGQFSGYVSFDADEHADFFFFLDQDVPFKIEDSSGTAVAPEETCNPAMCSEACDTIRGKYLVDLEEGKYAIFLGPTTQQKVHVLHEEGEHHHGAGGAGGAGGGGACGMAGADCTQPSDCCSNDCHVDHCH